MSKIAVHAGVALWIALLIGGSMVLYLHDAEPAAHASAPPHWPGASHLQRDPSRTTLLMFLHPNCACTSASLHELDRVVARTPPEDRPEIVFVTRPPARSDWRSKALLSEASAMPGAHLVLDQDGSEARAFAAEVSGQVMVYDKNGESLFDGGITSARGMEGSSLMASELVHVLRTNSEVPQGNRPVFGCRLYHG